MSAIHDTLRKVEEAARALAEARGTDLQTRRARDLEIARDEASALGHGGFAIQKAVDRGMGEPK